MRIPLTVSWFLALGLIHPIHMSFPALPEDLEGSGYDLESSGSGDLSEKVSPGEIINIKDQTNTKDVSIILENADGGTKNTFTGSSGPIQDLGSGFLVVANSKSIFENKEIFAAIIAGGVTGVVIAATLAAILIYTAQKKANGGFILGQQSSSDGGYHRPNREEVVV